MSLSTQEQILVEQRLANAKKSTGTTYLLWFFLSPFAGHRFYLGKTGSAILWLILWWGGLFLSLILIGVVPLIIVGIWWIVDGFRIPTLIESDLDRKRSLLTSEVTATSIEQPKL